MLWREIRSAAVRADERQARLRWQLSVRGEVHDPSRRALGRTAPSEGSGSSPRSTRRGSPEGAPGPNVSCQGAAPGPDRVTSHSLADPGWSPASRGSGPERPGCCWGAGGGGRTPPCRTRRTADSSHPTWAGCLQKDGSTAATRPQAGHVRRGGRRGQPGTGAPPGAGPPRCPQLTGQGTQRDARRRAAGGPGRPLARPRRRREPSPGAAEESVGSPRPDGTVGTSAARSSESPVTRTRNWAEVWELPWLLALSP